MSVSYGKGAYGKATKLHSKVVRERKVCENCGDKCYRNLQCAHIVSRRYSATRTLEENAFSFCASCHRYFSDWPVEFTKFIEKTIGLKKYEELKDLAQSGNKVNWEKEVDRLQRVYRKLTNEQ